MNTRPTVKHIMLPRRRISAEHQAWIDATAELAAAYSKRVHGPDESSAALDSFYLQIAADVVWTDSGGAPSWTTLDVERYLEQVIGVWSDQYVTAVLTLTAFYDWLVEAGHHTRAEVEPVVTTLDPHLFEVLGDLGRLRPPNRRGAANCFAASQTTGRRAARAQRPN